MQKASGKQMAKAHRRTPGSTVTKPRLLFGLLRFVPIDPHLIPVAGLELWCCRLRNWRI